MKFKLQKKINDFLNNSKDYPVLAGFSVGFYAFIFYFSNNFDLVNSWRQTFIFFVCFIISPPLIILLTCIILKKTSLSVYLTQGILVLMLVLLPIYLFGFLNLFLSYKKVGLLIFLILLIIILKIKNYKYLIILIFLASVFPTLKLGKIIYSNFTNSSEWQLQPDDIVKTKFKKKPNIYYIQPDGYTSEINLKGSLYRYDNLEFDNWLKDKKFTLYDEYRSNYESTLFSNSSSFYMKHHFANEFSNFNYARDYIVGENPVLKIFKNNNYKTFFITEKPYLLMNKPNVFYDYCNFKTDELPFFKDGMNLIKDVTFETKKQIVTNKGTNNFFFIQKFKPGHIPVYNDFSKGREQERINYIQNIRLANEWLKDIISFIEKNDPHSMIIIAADHGGFVGFDYTLQAQNKITDKKLLYSIFGAKLAIKWSDSQYVGYDSKLKTAVNLFRILFSYLSEDKALLDNLQSDTSYNCYDSSDFSKIYKAIED